MTFYRPLHSGWRVNAAGRPEIAAEVPGCVHLDLMAASAIPDPYAGNNEEELGWIGRTAWTYRTAFDWADEGFDHVDLECEGLDTIATVTLNGVEIARTANMHRRYRFPVRHLLHEGSNELSVTFGSVYEYTEMMVEALGARPAAYSEPFNFVRKMACNFGWDWGPTVVTAGIWRPIGLRSWSVARLATVRPLTTVRDGVGIVDVHVSLDRASEVPLTLSAALGSSAVRETVPAGQREAVLELRVEDPQLWWPRGYGAQPLHSLRIGLSDGDLELDSWTRRIGLRSVRIDTTPDDHGTPYTVVVNDVPVFVKGANWIPDDCFLPRITRARLAQRLGQACAANLNFLRIWGGGRYESEDFYELADELGLMVGQDFLFACAAYPEEEPFASEVDAEARDNIIRLMHHPSLVHWTGNNECLWGYADWHWQERLAGKTWGRGYYLETLPALMAELDPVRPYWPGSPYSGSEAHHPNDQAHGSMHIWDVWNSRDYVHYRDYTPRFVAEYGYQAPPTHSTRRHGSHQKAIDGELKLQRGLQAHLPPARDIDDWYFFTQVNQARAIALGVQHFRSLHPVCMGSVVWQLNDCWPVTSWSAIDGEGRLKPMWYAMRDSYADRLLTIQPQTQGLVLVAVNDHASPWSASVSVARSGFDGRCLAKETIAIEVAPRSAATHVLSRDLSTPEDPLFELLRARVDGAQAWWFFRQDRELAYPKAAWQARAEPVAGGMRVTVTAQTILRDLTLFPDRLDPDAGVDDALVTLLPGESATFTVHTEHLLDAAALTSRPVLRCVND